MATALASILGLFRPPAAASLDEGFRDPPEEARPHTWWHWMNGNVTREGITADLESMRRAGIGGAQVFVPDQGIPAGPAKYLSDEWRALFKFAAEEARRLGLELGMHNCAGWSSSGGPWVTPELAMQEVVTSEVRVSGPARFAEVLPRPASKNGFYRDISVMAFPAPEGETRDMESASPRVTGSVASFDGAALLDPDINRAGRLPRPTAEKPQHVQVDFPEPFTARILYLVSGPGLDWFSGELEVSDDGREYRTVRDVSFQGGWDRGRRTYVFPAATGRSFRLKITDGAGYGGGGIALGWLRLSPRQGIENLDGKAAYVRGSDFRTTAGGRTPVEMLVRREGIVDLTGRMDAGGRLEWEVPAGDWVVLRAGFTPTGRHNHPAPPEATGLECDKLSARAAEAHFSAVLDRLLGELGPLAGTAFRNLIIDSYEVGSQNWTPGFENEFRKRRGYDPRPFLPVLTGRIVDGVEVSERFLWDLRRTVADLFAEKYYGRMAELARGKNLKLGVEPYGSGTFEDIACGGRADVPMGEFWIGGGTLETCKLAGSIGHVYGRPVIGAEAFTASPERAGWRNHPGSMKTLGDLVFCLGVNRMIFHTFVHQPWLDRSPGMTMGHWGTHFGRLNTWWEPGAAWMKYLARCQFLLQQGRFVADLLYFCGEGAPSSLRSGDPALPEGYDYDGCNAEVVMKRLSVKGDRLVLPDGASYGALVLPPDEAMTPALLRRIGKLVRAGATVVGPRPARSPSLEDYPKCDRDVAALAGELWGGIDGKSVTEHRYGKGRVAWGKPLADVLAGGGLSPDFEYRGRGAKLAFIHRSLDGAEAYFISNQREVAAEVTCSFRVAGRAPELMRPETGAVERVPVFEESNGRTNLPLRLEAAESVFVVFRRAAGGADHAVSAAAVVTVAAPPPVLEIRRAVYEAEDGTGSADVTGLLRKMVGDGYLEVKAENGVLGGDPAPMHFKRLRVEYSADGEPGTAVVREHETLSVPEAVSSLEPARWRAAAAPDGSLELISREAGRYEVRTSAGGKVAVEVPAPPERVAVPGPWQVSFPAGWKAPESVTFAALVPWPDHADDGVRHFSGTAAYFTEFDLGRDLVGPDTVLTLDLGGVAVLAQVTLNGRDLGVLWKAPFRTDITAAAVAGKNRLEIRVTNLWPNRLIGDAKLPEDCEWEGDHLKAWPDWLARGKPSPTGRVTFATWKHWRASSPLLESGLLGPVTVYPARRVRVLRQ